MLSCNIKTKDLSSEEKGDLELKRYDAKDVSSVLSFIAQALKEKDLSPLTLSPVKLESVNGKNIARLETPKDMRLHDGDGRHIQLIIEIEHDSQNQNPEESKKEILFLCRKLIA